MKFAQAALALPAQNEGIRWRASVSPLIGLHAISMALQEIDRLSQEDRVLSLERAAVQIRLYAIEINRAWHGIELPIRIQGLLSEAHAALQSARDRGDEWVAVADGLMMPDLRAWAVECCARGFSGEVFAALPGTVLRAGSPALFIRPGILGNPPVDGLQRGRGTMRQIYRQFDASGGIARDVIAPMSAPLVGGSPLLRRITEGDSGLEGPVLPPLPQRPTTTWPLEFITA